MNKKDMARIEAITNECGWPVKGSVFPHKGKYLVSFCGHMDEFSTASDAFKWLSALFLKMTTTVWPERG